VLDVLEHTCQSLEALNNRVMQLIDQHLMKPLIIEQILDLYPPDPLVRNLGNS
jgi:hypothetical protein